MNKKDVPWLVRKKALQNNFYFGIALFAAFLFIYPVGAVFQLSKSALAAPIQKDQNLIMSKDLSTPTYILNNLTNAELLMNDSSLSLKSKPQHLDRENQFVCYADCFQKENFDSTTAHLVREHLTGSGKTREIAFQKLKLNCIDVVAFEVDRKARMAKIEPGTFYTALRRNDSKGIQANLRMDCLNNYK